MLGLVRAPRLREAEKTIAALRAQLEAAKERNWELLADVKSAELLRAAAEAEAGRLAAILTTHPPAEEAPPPAHRATAEPPPAPRVLTGLEVVQRATMHRATHNQALQGR